MRAGRTIRGVLGAVTATAVALTGLVATTSKAAAATSAETAAANAVLTLMNSERSAHHLSALRMSVALVSSARRHNLTMASHNTLSHQLPGEPVFTTRISQAGVAWHAAAENIGWTSNRSTSGAQGLQLAMYNEQAPNDGHRLNILSTAVHYVGVDVYLDSNTGKLWLTQDFADVAGPTPSVASHNPIGHVDTVQSLLGHRVRITGWSLDPDLKSVAPITAVYCDGHYVGYYRTNSPRPDVAARYHSAVNIGFNFIVVLPPGRHTINVYAINIRLGNASPRLASVVRYT